MPAEEDELGVDEDDAEPVDDEPVDAEPVDAEPVDAEPVDDVDPDEVPAADVVVGDDVVGAVAVPAVDVVEPDRVVVVPVAADAAVVPGISLDTTTPTTAAAPAARRAIPRDVRRTRTVATSRRAGPVRAPRLRAAPAGEPGAGDLGVGRGVPGAVGGFIAAMSPGEPRGSRTVSYERAENPRRPAPPRGSARPAAPREEGGW